MRLLENLLFISVLLLLAWVTVPDGSRGGVASAGLSTAVLTMSFLYVSLFFTHRHLREVLLAYRWIWLCLLAWLFVTAIQTFELFGYHNYDPYASIQELNLYFAYCAFLLLVTCLLSSQRRIRIIIGVLVVIAIAQTIFGLINYYSGEQPLGWKPTHWAAHRVTGTYINRNFFASLVVMVLGTVLVPVIIKRKNSARYDETGQDKINHLAIKTFCVIASVILLSGLVLSGSRGAFLSMAVATCLAVVLIQLNGRVSLRARYLVLVCVMSAVLFGARLLQARFNQNMVDATPKIQQWQATMELIAERWFSGYGPGTYEEAYKGNIPFEAAPLIHNHAHSDVLELLLEQGLAGWMPLAIAVLMAFVYALRHARKTKSVTRLAVILSSLFGVSSMVVHSMIDFPFQVPANVLIFLVLVAITLSASTINLQSRH